MPDLVLHSALILELCTYLRTELAKRTEPYAAGTVVARTVPGVRPDRLVTLANRGGHKVNAAMRRTTIDVNLWAKSSDELEADDLAALVTALLGLMNTPVVVDVEVTMTPADLPPEDGQPRRFMRLSVTHRAYPGE